MNEDEYLKAKKAMALTTTIGIVLESAELDDINRERLEHVVWTLTHLFLDDYEVGREELEPDNKQFHTGMGW